MSSLRRVQNYISTVQPPAYPFPVDRALAAAGADNLRRRSARRATRSGGAAPGTVIPLAEIGTDRHRLDMWTQASAAAYNAYGDGHAWKFSHFSTTGRLRVGAARGPLAASAVPAQRLGADADRSAGAGGARARREFWRGYDVYDPVRVGFVTSGAGAEREGTLFDINLPGNSNAGHLYGTRLPPDAKRALLEFMKTL